MTVFTHFENAWQEGAPLVQTAMAQSFMHGSTVFDGARAFSGCVPDLDRHFSRLINSAEVMGLKSPFSVQEITEIITPGAFCAPKGYLLFIDPFIYWSEVRAYEFDNAIGAIVLAPPPPISNRLLKTLNLKKTVFF